MHNTSAQNGEVQLQFLTTNSSLYFWFPWKTLQRRPEIEHLCVWEGGLKTVESGVEDFQCEREQKCSPHLWAQPSSRRDRIWKRSDRLERVVPHVTPASWHTLTAKGVLKRLVHRGSRLRTEADFENQEIAGRGLNMKGQTYCITWTDTDAAPMRQRAHCEKLQHIAWWCCTASTLHTQKAWRISHLWNRQKSISSKTFHLTYIWSHLTKSIGFVSDVLRTNL